MTLINDYWGIVDKKNSVLCAGLDPAEFQMGNGNAGLAAGVNKRDWALAYVEAVAPYCAALKYNAQFWGGLEDSRSLTAAVEFALNKGLLVIGDHKFADIGSTNEAGMYFAKNRGCHAVTVAPYAGNLEEMAEQGETMGIGIITMCLMSNPGYELEKNKLVQVSPDQFSEEDIIKVNGETYVKQYIALAQSASRIGVDGIVIGAPSKDNRITEKEIEDVHGYSVSGMMVLLPGVGRQGGEAEIIWKYFDDDQVIVNVGRALMLPKGSGSTPTDQAEAARHYRDLLNDLRKS
jgi:orotidine-5'-phosphate decarboxylase